MVHQLKCVVHAEKFDLVAVVVFYIWSGKKFVKKEFTQHDYIKSVDMQHTNTKHTSKKSIN